MVPSGEAVSTGKSACQELDVSIPSMGVTLVCTLLRPISADLQAGPAVVMCHGAHGNRSQFLAFGRVLADAGIVVLLPDMHGHGGSGGVRHHVRMAEWVPDVRHCLDWLSAQPFVDAGALGAFGFSSGGTAVLESAAIDGRLRALVTLDATVRPVVSFVERYFLLFCSWLGTLKQRWFGSNLHLPLYPVARHARVAVDPIVNAEAFDDPVMREAYWRYPLPGALDSLIVDTLSRVDRITAPVCVIHGEDDKLDPPASAHALFQCLRSEKALYLIPDSGHMGHLDRQRDRIAGLVRDWFVQHLKR